MREGTRGGDPENVRPTEAGAHFLHGVEARTSKSPCIAPLMGRMIDSDEIARRSAFCIAKHTVLENLCPFRVGLLHKHDQIPKQNGGARHKPQNVLEFFSQNEANGHRKGGGQQNARFWRASTALWREQHFCNFDEEALPENDNDVCHLTNNNYY